MAPGLLMGRRQRMAKRLTETNLWHEDWFVNLPTSAMLLWSFARDQCDHAGIWKGNLSLFHYVTQYDLTIKEFLELINKDKLRIRRIPNGRYFITGFIPFQQGNTLNMKNWAHVAILRILRENEIRLDWISDTIHIQNGDILKTRSPVKDGPELLAYIKEYASQEKS